MPNPSIAILKIALSKISNIVKGDPYSSPEAFFRKFGYQMVTADFVGFILRQLEDGSHDLALATEHVSGSYSCTKITDANLLHSRTKTDELCLAIEKTTRNSYTNVEYAPGMLSIISYGKQPNGVIDLDKAVVRAYLLQKYKITPLEASVVEEAYSPTLDSTIYSYADAWAYEGMQEDILRGLIYE